MEDKEETIKNLNTFITKVKDGKINFNSKTVKDLFMLSNIRTKDKEEPLFCLIDIANIIGDDNYRRFKSDYIVIAEMNDENGRKHPYKMLKELGLYEYLFKSKQPNAKLLRECIHEILTLSKKSTVFEYNSDALIDCDKYKETYSLSDNEFIQLVTIFNKYKVNLRNSSDKFIKEVTNKIKNRVDTNCMFYITSL